MCLITLVMSESYSRALGYRYSAPLRNLFRRISSNRTDGFDIPTPTLKKSAGRKSPNRFRRRSILQAVPNASSDMGTAQFAAPNSNAWSAEHAKNPRGRRLVQRKVRVPTSDRLLQRGYLHLFSRPDATSVILQKKTPHLSHPGQRFVSQEAGGIRVV